MTPQPPALASRSSIMPTSSIMPSITSSILSVTLSVSLALGSTVALAAPAATPASEQTPDSETVDTGATAEEKTEAEQLSEKAIAEFSTKNYAGAVALFEQAYELDPQPNYLFNIGRVYEEAGELENAVKFYSRFVKQPGVDLDARGVALERLRVLRAIVEETKEPTEAPKQEPKEEPKEVAPITPPPQPVDTDSQRKRKAMRGAGFGLLGVGAGAMIGAAVVGSLAQSDNDKAFDRDQADSLATRQDFLEKAQGKALTADVLYGVGGALLLTGVVLVVVGFSKPKQTQRVALTPSLGVGSGGVGGGMDLRFRF